MNTKMERKKMDVKRVWRGQRETRKEKMCIYAQDLEEKHYADEQTISLHCRESW